MPDTLPRPTPPVAVESPPSPPRSRWPWVPIRSLGARHRQRIAAHLQALDPRSRYLRFGYIATDEQIDRYVDGLDFERDEIHGIFNRRLELIALAHLALAPAMDSPLPLRSAEFGVSVLEQARRRGFGRHLFENAVLHARNRGIGALHIHALSENTAMLKLARSAGATVRRGGAESEAHLELPPESFASRLDALIGTHAAELDYRLKSHALRPQNLPHPNEEEGAAAPGSPPAPGM